MWAISATSVASLKKIPTYEILSIVFLIGFICSASYNTYNRNWKKTLDHPFYIWIIGIIGIFGNEVLFIESFKHAPVAHVDLINFLWPIMVIFFSSLFPKEKLQFRYFLASLIAFIGIYILIFYDEGQNINFQHQYIKGYLYALFAAFFWTFYTIISKFYGKLKTEMIGIYCGLGFILSFLMHLAYEKTIMPTLSNFISLIFMGIATHCLAYFFWDYGVKKGNFKLLSILSYFNPIISISILIIAGYSKPTYVLFISSFLIFSAGLIGGLTWKKSKSPKNIN